MPSIPAPRLLLGYALTSAVFLAVDLLWLGVVAKRLYARHLGPLLADQVNWAAALVFYGLFIIGILVFAVFPALDRESGRHALLLGALFGFIAYATYDLTNLATLEGWPAAIVAIDMAWGAVLTAAVSLAGYHIFRWLG